MGLWSAQELGRFVALPLGLATQGAPSSTGVRSTGLSRRVGSRRPLLKRFREGGFRYIHPNLNDRASNIWSSEERKETDFRS
jgi:hypothetical protein